MSALPQNVPTRTVVLDGAPRVLAFTLGALRRVRARLGDEMLAMEAMDLDWILDHAGGLLWDLLADPADREALPQDGLEERIPFHQVTEIADALGALLTDSGVAVEPEGAAEAGEGANPPKRKRASKS